MLKIKSVKVGTAPTLAGGRNHGHGSGQKARPWSPESWIVQRRAPAKGRNSIQSNQRDIKARVKPETLQRAEMKSPVNVDHFPGAIGEISRDDGTDRPPDIGGFAPAIDGSQTLRK
jgi:hypothetical protein